MMMMMMMIMMIKTFISNIIVIIIIIIRFVLSSTTSTLVPGSSYLPSTPKYSVDKVMIPYFGKHSTKQFIRGKSVQYGFKVMMMMMIKTFISIIICRFGVSQLLMEKETTSNPIVENIPASWT